MTFHRFLLEIRWVFRESLLDHTMIFICKLYIYIYISATFSQKTGFFFILFFENLSIFSLMKSTHNRKQSRLFHVDWICSDFFSKNWAESRLTLRVDMVT